MPTIEALERTCRIGAAAGIFTAGIAVKDGHAVYAQETPVNSGYELILDESIQDRDDIALAELGLTVAEPSFESAAARISILGDVPPVSNQNFEGSLQEDGTFLIRVKRENYIGPALAEVPGIYRDSSISYDGKLINNIDNSRFLTIRMRWQDGINSGYGTLVDPVEQRFRIYRMEDGRDNTLVPWQYSDAIHEGLNSLTFGGAGNRLSLLINGVELATTYDNKFSGGKVFFGIGGPRGVAEAIIENLLIQDEIPETVLYDDFDDPSKGLFRPGGYIDGELEIRTPQGENSWAEWTRRSFGDSVISVDARIIQSGVGNPPQITVGCRATEKGAIMLTVTPNLKYFSISRWEDNHLIILKNGNNNAILAGENVNHINLACEGSIITATINSVDLAEVSDTTHIFGSAFLGIGRVGIARYDNFTISKP